MFAFREIRAKGAHESFPLFDWLRFALASVVALSHEQLIPWHDAGNFAVQVFFALSGWLIGGILLRSERKDLPRFYFNRATRIWIPYFIAVAVLYGLAVVKEGIGHDFVRSLIYDSTFTHNWFVNPLTLDMPLAGTGNHFWSISVEEQFYLAAPLLIVLLPRSKWLWAALSMVAIGTQFWYGSICLGVLAAMVRPKGPWIAPVTALLALVLIIDPSLYKWICSPLAAGIVLMLSRSGPRSSVGEFLGGVSYPLYLYHWIGGFAAHFLHLNFIAYPVAVIAGTLAYLAIDRNVMKLRGRFYSPKAGKALMVSAYSLLAAGLAYAAMG